MMLVKLKYFWTLSMTEAGSVLSIWPSKTNNWVRQTNSVICHNRKWTKFKQQFLLYVVFVVVRVGHLSGVKFVTGKVSQSSTQEGEGCSLP